MSTEPPLPKGYQPRQVEKRSYSFWLERRLFEARPDLAAPRFAMVLPPPNVTGPLHMGHAFGTTLQDILIRWKRMQGFDVLWLPGIDHAGIATQNVVERQLAREGKSRWDVGREPFLARVWKWKDKSATTIVSQLKKLGGSLDWSRMRFTLDPELSETVRTVFVRLYREGLIYRGNYVVNWCPRCRTAISDLEVQHREAEGKLYTIRYPLQGSKDYVKVATTRPETMLGDTGLAVHPEDERHHKLIGRRAILPLVGRELLIVADRTVERNFGSGVVKVTPAHDPLDFEIGERHGLERVVVIDEGGLMNEKAGPFAGKDRFKARKEIVAQLRSENRIEKVAPYRHSLGHCQRCETVVEPYLSTQWFVRVKSLAGPAILAVDEGRVRLVPQSWARTYFEWMRNIHDWCISRQLWWGHRVPAWYCRGASHITVSEVEPVACGTCGSAELEQDPDVLDTWFSSSLWPFSSLGWPRSTTDFNTYYPNEILVTGFDILFFWVARMIMMGLKFTGQVPFRAVYITALVRDEQGQKMSKSKGNVIDPLEVCEKYGTDAVRFTLAAKAVPGTDIPLSAGEMGGYLAFLNKLWNAARFVLMNMDPAMSPFQGDPRALKLPQRWILSRSSRIAAEVGEALGRFRFDEAALGLRRFVWDEFCDWYLETAKLDLGKEDRRPEALGVLLAVFDRLLRLLHPFVPFITEEIWQKLPHLEESLAVARFPQPVRGWEDAEAEREMGSLMGVISAVRRIRSEYNVDPGRKIPIALKVGDGRIRSLLDSHREVMAALARVEELKFDEELPLRPGTVKQMAGGVEIAVTLAGLFDPRVEIGRLSRDVGKIERELEGLAKKLANMDFLAKASPDVVRAAQQRAGELQKKREKIEESLRLLLHSA